MRTIPVAILLVLSFLCQAQTDTLKIHINTGTFKAVDLRALPAKCFNESAKFNFNSQLFQVKTGQKTVLKFLNHDTIEHSLTLESAFTHLKIKAGASNSFILNTTKPGMLHLYEDGVGGSQKYLGLSGLILVSDQSKNTFFWNLKEFQHSYNANIAAGGSVDFAVYQPNYFLINGKSNPEIGTDSLAKIRGEVGDTIKLYIVNSGNSIHSIHFHGYHFTIEESSRSTTVIGWEKDTYAIYPDEVVLLTIIPDKPGEYPVHDHNLIAITANNTYPNGMFTTMVIKE